MDGVEWSPGKVPNTSLGGDNFGPQFNSRHRQFIIILHGVDHVLDLLET